MWKDITEKEKTVFNSLITHPLQSYEWGEFRKKTGITVVKRGFFEEGKFQNVYQLTIHKIPHTPWTIGYVPKGEMPSLSLLSDLKFIGKQYNCIFIQLEPNVYFSSEKIKDMRHLPLIPAAHPLFTRYTFQLDLIKTEEELLKNMSQKTRYNIKVAQKHHVIVKKEHSEKAFAAYLQLTKETTQRQGFYAHTTKYHQLMWETLRDRSQKLDKNILQAHLFVASLDDIPLTTWIVFTFHDMLYYPYGASSSQHREAMSSNLMMWEVIKFGKKMNLKLFDMWGALGPNADPKDPWRGFHRFKQGYGPELVEFIGSYDLVINPLLYNGYKVADKLRWLLLRSRK